MTPATTARTLARCTPGPLRRSWVSTSGTWSRIRIATYEGRYYFDEWDKALRVRGLVKQQRELYRQAARLSRAAGGLRVGAAGGYASGQFRRRPGRLVDQQLSQNRAAVSADRLSGSASAVRSGAAVCRVSTLPEELPLLEVTAKRSLRTNRRHCKELRVSTTAEEKFDHDSVVHLLNPTRDAQTAPDSVPITWPTSTMIDQKVGQILDGA